MWCSLEFTRSTDTDSEVTFIVDPNRDGPQHDFWMTSDCDPSSAVSAFVDSHGPTEIRFRTAVFVPGDVDVDISQAPYC